MVVPTNQKDMQEKVTVQKDTHRSVDTEIRQRLYSQRSCRWYYRRAHNYTAGNSLRECCRTSSAGKETN